MYRCEKVLNTELGIYFITSYEQELVYWIKKYISKGIITLPKLHFKQCSFLIPPQQIGIE